MLKRITGAARYRIPNFDHRHHAKSSDVIRSAFFPVKFSYRWTITSQ
jgi:hypothetical protein